MTGFTAYAGYQAINQWQRWYNNGIHGKKVESPITPAQNLTGGGDRGVDGGSGGGVGGCGSSSIGNSSGITKDV